MGKIIRTIIPFVLFTIIFCFGCTKEISEEIKQNQPEPKIYEASIGSIAKTELAQLIPWEDNAISINIPIGWNIYIRGECSTKSLLSRDPYSELKQLFYFSEAGPVYTSQQMKENDKDYMDMGGYDILWFESPVVNPLTAENYLMNFGILARTSFFQQAFPEVPIIDEVKIINKQSIADKPSYISDAKLIRAEFRQNNKLGEGYFYIVTADIFGLGYGMMFTGITAPKGLLDLIVPSLLQSLKSFTVSSEYVDACIRAQNNAATGALEAGRILDKSSDTIMEVWENKLESEQRISEKQSAAILGYSRLYNPQTDEVYEITPEFYEYYQNHSNEFELDYLQEMPDDKWSYAPLNGAHYIK
ncbi:MAG TPA: hypothetical protein DCP02_07490 [Actinobacteria bacterium]|nr:hypothetical protein [Actinomycetota bacterium]